MEWLNIPAIELALGVGGFAGFLMGFLSAWGVESWAGYRRGYQAGYRHATKERDAE